MRSWLPVGSLVSRIVFNLLIFGTIYAAFLHDDREQDILTYALGWSLVLIGFLAWDIWAAYRDRGYDYDWKS